MKRRIGIMAIVGMILVGGMAGCAQKQEEVKNEPVKQESQEAIKFVDDSYMTTAKEVNENSKNIILLDARGAKDFEKNHIDGSIQVTWQEFSKMEGKPGDAAWGTLLEPQELAKKFQALGISKDSKVVVYGAAQNGWGEEGRIVWMLKMAGVNNASFVDGGFEALKSQGMKASTEIVTPSPSAEMKVEALDMTVSIDTKTLKENLNSGMKIIDTREKEEFEGATKYGEARGGHIPGAINIPYKNLFNEDGSLKSAEELQKLFEENKIAKGDKVVTYCTAGIRSAYMLNVMKMLGYEDVKNYQDSFYGWAGDKETEIEK